MPIYPSLRIKNPSDNFLWTLNPTGVLENGETITSGTVVSSPADLSVSGATTTSNSLSIPLSGGTPGTYYHVQTTIYTNSGSQYNDSYRILCQTADWFWEMGRIVRLIIGDIGDTPRYTDATLAELILSSALQVVSEAYFNNKYNINIGTLNLSPDPTLDQYRDNPFINLVTLKTACNLDIADLRCRARLANISIKDNMGTISTQNTVQGFSDLIDKGPCALYAESLKQFRFSGPMSNTIETPFSSASLTYPLNGYAGGNFWGDRAFRNFSYF